MAWLALLSALSSCVDSEPRPAGVNTATGVSLQEPNWCATLCNTYRHCEGQIANSCVTTCLEANRAYLARSSGPAIEFEMRCMASAVCTEDFQDLLAECFTDVLTALEPTEDAQQLCDDLASEFFTCSWFSSKDGCARFHASYSAAALASERDCASSSCEELGACIEARLYSYGE